MELYIHIPFCVRKCEYCSFVSFPADNVQKEKYIESLLDETKVRREEFREPVNTVFIGGGTPSLLSPDQFQKLVTGIRQYVSIDPHAEFSVEANPGTLTDEFVEKAAELGANRFSIGMQAFQELLLKRLGRIHTFTEVVESVQLIKKQGLQNINLDLIFGIPGQSLSDWKETLDRAISLDPTHISAYGLIPEEGTPLFSSIQKGQYFLPEQEEEREMYDFAIRKLKEKGYLQYEISNFAKKGFECRHNIGYWTQVPYVGLGLSAASMAVMDKSDKGMTCIRRKNPDHMQDYWRMICQQKDDIAEFEKIGSNEARFETMMLALRMNRGISEERFFTLHGISIDACYGRKLTEMQGKGLLKHENGSWFLTRKGMDIQNTVLVELMDEI